MANIVRIKRRAAGGSAGAPSSLQNAELAYNEVDDTLYYGKGSGGAGGTATTVEAIAGTGAFVTRSTTQTISGDKTFTGAVVVPTPTSASHAVTKAYADALASGGVAAGDGITVTGSGVQTIAVDSTIARLSSPAFTGTPTAPTAATATNSTQIATTAFVQAAVSALINAAPGALDTLNEIAAALGNDPNFATTITNELATKLTKSSNLSDLTNVSTARTNLGLGTIATQAASNVAITGGSITNLTTFDGITIDGGTF